MRVAGVLSLLRLMLPRSMMLVSRVEVFFCCAGRSGRGGGWSTPALVSLA